jgi:hypothetical protein
LYNKGVGGCQELLQRWSQRGKRDGHQTNPCRAGEKDNFGAGSRDPAPSHCCTGGKVPVHCEWTLVFRSRCYSGRKPAVLLGKRAFGSNSRLLNVGPLASSYLGSSLGLITKTGQSAGVFYELLIEGSGLQKSSDVRIAKFFSSIIYRLYLRLTLNVNLYAMDGHLRKEMIMSVSHPCQRPAIHDSANLSRAGFGYKLDLSPIC